MSNEVLTPKAFAETVVHAGREVLRCGPEFAFDYLKHHPFSSVTAIATGTGLRLGMTGVDAGWAIATVGVVATPVLMVAENAVDRYVRQHRKMITKLESRSIDQDITGLDVRDVERGKMVRRHLLGIIREFVPKDYLSRGVILNYDGDSYWAKQVHDNFINQSSSDYEFELLAIMGENGQSYIASANYNLRWELVNAYLSAGDIPTFITPAHLPKPIPGFTQSHIPPESIREVAEMVYDLPMDKTWESTSYQEIPYMSNEPEREFAMEIAEGETFDGRKFDLEIDEQSFSRLRVQPN